MTICNICRKFVWNNNMQIDIQERRNAKKESNNAQCAKMTLHLQIVKSDCLLGQIAKCCPERQFSLKKTGRLNEYVHDIMITISEKRK